ncbi:unnamed protein product [Ectocarpus fasciculatus]
MLRTMKARKEVRARRVRVQEEKAARMVTRALRRKQGKARLQALRLLKNREASAAIVLQKLWRKAIARMCASRLRREREERERARRATTIQRTYRGVLGRRKARRRRVEKTEQRKREMAASRMIQQRFRMHRAKVKCATLREQAERLRRKRDKSTRVLQQRWRSYRARQELERLKHLLRLEKARKKAAATCIQKFVRVSRCRKLLEQKRRERAHRHASATTIQRHYRGVVARVQYVILCEKRQVEREKGAALRLQCWQRLITSKALCSVLAMNKQLRQVREQNGAKTIQQFYRRYRIRVEAEARKKNHEDEVRAMSRLEDWAATQIQVSGEIRWRRPQDFLELLPRPSCGDCCLFEAFSECADCGEFFCSACYRKVHGGGKRLHHEFRALYDYYGKRVDYGEGEFPSCWPTDVIQARRLDDENGWQLRVAPEREPAEERGDWTRYTAEGGGDNADGSAYPGEDLYYNAVTGESSYQAPAEWDWLETQALETSFFDVEPSEETANGSSASWSNDISQVTGDSSYFYSGEPMLALEGDDANTDGEEQSYGGIMVEGSGAGYSTSWGDWTKYYDAEYAVDYYHNFRTSETQYDRPEGFQTPRG